MLGKFFLRGKARGFVLQVRSRHSKVCHIFLLALLAGLVVNSGCVPLMLSFPAVTSTFQAMSSEIDAPLETCPNISGTYEFVGTPLPGMPPHFHPGGFGKLTLDRFLRLDLKKLNNRDPVTGVVSTLEKVTEVEITHDQILQLHFKGPLGRETVVLPESSEDSEDQIQIGCSKGKIIRVRTEEAFGEGVTGTSVIKTTLFKSADGSLQITLQDVAYLRSLALVFLVFWEFEEEYGARFVPRTFGEKK